MEKTTKEHSTPIKIVLFGPESTGKTTLSRQLAEHYNTVWVPEYSRTYAQNKWDNHKEKLVESDILPIVNGQLKSEDSLLPKANKILICDTDVLETMVYCKIYYSNYPKATLEEIIESKHYDFYFLTYIDIPWKKDDLRDKPNEREQMFQLFKNTLEEYKKPYVILKGNKEKRFRSATEIIDNLLLKNSK